MDWYPSPNGYLFKHITDQDYDHVYYEIGRGSPGSLYKVTHTIDKTGAKVPSLSFVKSEGEMSEKEISNIKNNWLKTATVRYEEVDPHTYFKHLLVAVKDKNKLPPRLRSAVFTTYLDPKLSNLVKPNTKEVFGDILDNL